MKRRKTVDERIEMRNRGNIAKGTPPGWSDDALDMYLAEFDVREICECYGVTPHTFYDAIAKAALFRLMKQRDCEHMNEIQELMNGAHH